MMMSYLRYFRRHLKVIILEETLIQPQLHQRLLLSLRVHLATHEAAIWQVEEAGVDAALHEDDDVDGVEDLDVFAEHEARVGLGEADQRFEHADGFAVFGERGPPAQVGEVGLEDHLRLLSTNRLYIPLHKYDILHQFIRRPRRLNLIL